MRTVAAAVGAHCPIRIVAACGDTANCGRLESQQGGDLGRVDGVLAGASEVRSPLQANLGLGQGCVLGRRVSCAEADVAQGTGFGRGA